MPFNFAESKSLREIWSLRSPIVISFKIYHLYEKSQAKKVLRSIGSVVQNVHTFECTKLCFRLQNRVCEFSKVCTSKRLDPTDPKTFFCLVLLMKSPRFQPISPSASEDWDLGWLLLLGNVAEFEFSILDLRRICHLSIERFRSLDRPA